MGSWFSNFHIKKTGQQSKDELARLLDNILRQQGWLPASEDDADGGFAISCKSDSQWFSVYSDIFSFEDPKAFAVLSQPLSLGLKTDILGISCYDSDYMYLNLINAVDGVDAWLGVGSAAGLGITRRNKPSAWKGRVRDFEKFTQAVKSKYVFAEEALAELSGCLGLPMALATAEYEYLDMLPEDTETSRFYFQLPEGANTKAPPRLVHQTFSLMPCRCGHPSMVDLINDGGESRGLSVYFLGPYVEKDEITFSKVCFVQWKNGKIFDSPIQLEKIRLEDGRWVYYYHDPGFRIPGKMERELPPSKKLQDERLKRSIILRFIPQGNPRKMLDISVVLVPDKNPEGQAVWNVLSCFGNKKEFIRQHNDIWRKHINCEHLLLDEADFD